MRIFDTVYFVLWEMLPHYHFVLRWFSTDVPGLWHWLWHFARIIVKGPWAKVARRCHGLLLTAGVGNTQPGEEKTSCHIFSVDSFANSDCGPLHWSCIAVHWKRKKKKRVNSDLLKPFGFPHLPTLWRHQDLHRLITFEPNPEQQLNLCALCNI